MLLSGGNMLISFGTVAREIIPNYQDKNPRGLQISKLGDAHTERRGFEFMLK